MQVGNEILLSVAMEGPIDDLPVPIILWIYQQQFLLRFPFLWFRGCWFLPSLPPLFLSNLGMRFPMWKCSHLARSLHTLPPPPLPRGSSYRLRPKERALDMYCRPGPLWADVCMLCVPVGCCVSACVPCVPGAVSNVGKFISQSEWVLTKRKLSVSLESSCCGWAGCKRGASRAWDSTCFNGYTPISAF